MKYAARRILALFITMILVSFLAFAAFHIISGDPARAILGMNATEKQLEMMRHELGLDKPFLVQYFNWLLGFFSGNLGISYSYRQPVASLIIPKLKVTLVMVLISFVIIVILSLPLGLRAAQKSGSRFEWIGTTINQLCMAVPAFFLSILVSYVFGIILKVFTPGDFPKMERDLFGAIRYLFFAAVCIAIPRIAMAVRMLKSTLIEEMEMDYVRTAISRGNDRVEVLKKHVMKNSLVPTITFLGQTMAEIVGGSIVVEQVFGIPGMGRFLVASIPNRDYPVGEALVVILAFWVILSGSVADLINQKIDPRLKLGGRA